MPPVVQTLSGTSRLSYCAATARYLSAQLLTGLAPLMALSQLAWIILECVMDSDFQSKPVLDGRYWL